MENLVTLRRTSTKAKKSSKRECKKFKELFMDCLRENGHDNHKCRLESKNYLECRMERDLMKREPMSKLGFSDLGDADKSKAGSASDS